MVRRFPVRLARHAAARLAPAAHPPRLAAPPEGGGPLGGGVGGEPGALRPPPRRQGEYDLVCFAPYLFGTTLRGVPLVPGRAVLIPCLHDEPFAHLGVVRETFQACRGFIFNSPPEAALAEKLYGIGDRPAGVVGLGFEPPPHADPEALRRRHGLEGPLLLYLGRKETGKNVPLLIEYALRYRAVRRLRPDARPRRRRPGHRAARHPGRPGPRLPRRRREGGRLRGRHGRVPAVRQRVLLDRPDGGVARGHAGPRPRPLPGHHAPRPQRRRRPGLRRLLRVRGGARPAPRGRRAAPPARRARAGPTSRPMYSWPAVTARLRETLERLVA